MRMIFRASYFYFSDLKNNKGYFIFATIQITLVMLLIGYMLQLGSDSIKTISELNDINEKGNVYQIDCIAEAGQIDKLINTEEGQEKFKSFYTFLNSLDGIQCVTADSSLAVYMQCENKKMRALSEDSFDETASFSALRVSNDFFDFYNVCVSDSREYCLQEFFDYNGENEIPVVLGHNFKSIYDYDDTFIDNGGRSYRVIGFLEKGEMYAAPFETDKAKNLDNWMVIPKKVESSEDGMNYITGLVSTFFISDNDLIMKTVVEKSKELELLPLEYHMLDKQIKFVIDDLKNEAITMGSILLLIFVFAATGMISYMVHFIQERLHEFAIHMLCGANYRDIILRIVIQLVCILLIADFFVIIFFDDVIVMCATILLSVLYGLGITAYPLHICKENNIVNIIRRI